MPLAFVSDHHLDVDALGTTIRIAIDDLPPNDRMLLRETWSGARSFTHRDSPRIVGPRPHFHFDDTVADLSTQVTLAGLEAGRGRLWMVHAGAVADEHGRVVMFSGRSGMGKTTLISKVAREYAYVTDESVGVTADGSVLPYRKPLSVIEDTARAKRQRSPHSLGLRELPPMPLRLHAIVVLDRTHEDVTPSLDSMDIADAVGQIAPQCSYLPELDHPLRTLTDHICRVGGARRLRYRESGDVMPLLRALFSEARDTPRTSREASKPFVARAIGNGSAQSLLGRMPTIDEIEVDGGRLLILRRDDDDRTSVHVLDGIGPALWRSLDGASFDDLVCVAVRTHGSPPQANARDAVRAALRQMKTSGLIHGSV